MQNLPPRFLPGRFCLFISFRQTAVYFLLNGKTDSFGILAVKLQRQFFCSFPAAKRESAFSDIPGQPDSASIPVGSDDFGQHPESRDRHSLQILSPVRRLQKQRSRLQTFPEISGCRDHCGHHPRSPDQKYPQKPRIVYGPGPKIPHNQHKSAAAETNPYQIPSSFSALPRQTLI